MYTLAKYSNKFNIHVPTVFLNCMISGKFSRAIAVLCTEIVVATDKQITAAVGEKLLGLHVVQWLRPTCPWVINYVFKQNGAPWHAVKATTKFC